MSRLAILTISFMLAGAGGAAAQNMFTQAMNATSDMVVNGANNIKSGLHRLSLNPAHVVARDAHSGSPAYPLVHDPFASKQTQYSALPAAAPTPPSNQAAFTGPIVEVFPGYGISDSNDPVRVNTEGGVTSLGKNVANGVRNLFGRNG